ncbi:O-antigen ligase family protein [Streptomyces canus]|uniref:O-antigen ligase family protein n=1 Tax=Streptomyces canus TaxID=58343 RepID=UPI0027816E50|nr:O-antigen ligase family protein [Streptomyces canus]MDQ0762555.1 O-antigen ligase [Streptomyces canus]MDQ1069005.1 O-antigen ligase [Streptomyces canus]
MTSPSDTELLLLCVFAVVCTAAVLVVSICVQSTVWLLWGLCLLPLFLFGRTYAAVGISPVYLLDLFAVIASISAVGVWGPRAFSEQRMRGFRGAALLLAVLAALAVYRGLEAGYSDPLKGGILGLYPVLGWLAATWMLTRSEWELTRWRWILFVPTLGVFLNAALGMPITPAASGLYLVIASAFSIQLHHLGDSRLLVWTLVGTAALTAIGSKRGPLLAVVAAMLATAIASRSNRRRVKRLPFVSLTLVTMGVLGAIGLSMSGERLSEAPVVGGLIARVEASAENPDSESANNVELRLLMWKEALRAASEEPLFGTGAGRPLDVVFERQPLNDPKSGPHNSFVGYIYYVGWPAGIAVILIVGVTLRRTWRARHHLVAASWFGATVGVCVTAFTNVAFETTYIGLPSWLVIAGAYSLVGVPRGEETAERREPKPSVQQGSEQGAVPGRGPRILPGVPTVCSRG